MLMRWLLYVIWTSIAATWRRKRIWTCGAAYEGRHCGVYNYGGGMCRQCGALRETWGYPAGAGLNAGLVDYVRERMRTEAAVDQ